MRSRVKLDDRLVAFSCDVCNELENCDSSFAQVNLVKQLTRSATSVTLNFSEALSAESPKDDIHKMKVGLKELNETRYGLRILLGIKGSGSSEIERLLIESGELVGIFVGCIRTAEKRL
ncbi:MAG: four helix bundle protein [Flavobacteriales bacterium]|nr:four helix bundle protein [Flavobacteriales bacterium]